MKTIKSNNNKKKKNKNKKKAREKGTTEQLLGVTEKKMLELGITP